MKPVKMLLAHLRRDGGTQPRATMDTDVIADYAAHLDDLPPVVAFHDGKSYWLADGFHRVLAAEQLRAQRIAVEVRKGTQRDAILYSCGANAAHGLRRSNADKRRAVETLLADEEWSQWSDRRIAEAVGVSNNFVSDARRQLSSDDTQRVGRDGVSREIRKDSTPGQPTAGLPTSPANLADEGDEGAGAEELPRLGPAAKAPAPDEPEAMEEAPCVDMLGLRAHIEWVLAANAAVAVVDAIDGELRRLQGAARALPQPIQQRLYSALHDAAACARAVRPAVACPICKDPDGTGGRRDACLACASNGWLTEEGKSGVHPGVLRTVEKVNKALPKARQIRVELPDGDVYEPDDDEAF